MDAPTFEEVERARQWAQRAVGSLSLDELRIARARLTDLLQSSPSEPIATIARVRGEVAHAEIKRREAGTGLRGAVKRLWAVGDYTLRQFLDLPGATIERKG